MVRSASVLFVEHDRRRSARKRLEQMLDARMNPAMRYFIDVFVGSFSLPLDELNAH